MTIIFQFRAKTCAILTIYVHFLLDEIDHRCRCDGTFEARSKWGSCLLHGIFGREFRLAVESTEAVDSKLFHIRLSWPSGALHTSSIDDENIQSFKCAWLLFMHSASHRFPLLF